jgi:hypothetical protein
MSAAGKLVLCGTACACFKCLYDPGFWTRCMRAVTQALDFLGLKGVRLVTQEPMAVVSLNVLQDRRGAYRAVKEIKHERGTHGACVDGYEQGPFKRTQDYRSRHCFECATVAGQHWSCVTSSLHHACAKSSTARRRSQSSGY